MACIVSLLMVAFVIYYYYQPGNWVYVFIVLFFVNLYSAIKSTKNLIMLRKVLKFCVLTAEMGYKIQRLGICGIVESIKQSKINESKNNNDIQSDLEGPS